MDDDPFEIRLQNIFEVQMDEFEEKELRRLLLDGKIEQIRLKNPLLSDSKINSIYKSLNKKDSEIYIDRIQQTIQDQKERALFKWSVEGFEVCSFADASLHGEKNVVGLIQEINPKSPYPIDPVKYSTLWARGIQFSVNESTMNFRDYPLPYLLAQNTHIAGKLIGAGAHHGGRTVRDTSISAPEPWGTFTINRNMNPLKFYYDLGCEFEKLKINYGPCWEPCLSMISQCWNLINAPSKDPSEPLPFWDKIRLLLHGRFSMRGKRNYPNARIVTAMLASTDPYDKTEKLKVVWDNFIFDWRTGEFLIKSNINAYIKTASKYDDSRLISLPNVESNIRLDWNCLGNQHDHHSITPCAPGKLPYSTNSNHDSYRAFRSSHLDLIIKFQCINSSSSPSKQYPQILLYANTFKCLDQILKTLMTVNLPVRRGSYYKTPRLRKRQLSRHLKHVQLYVTLPKFIISYWMSVSASHGFKVLSDSLQLTSAMQLHISTSTSASDDGIKRRPKSIWKMSHTSGNLEKTQIHLFNPGPSTDNDAETFCNTNISDKSFFAGLSRLIYTCESHRKNRLFSWEEMLEDFTATKSSPIHRLTVHEFKGAWTIANRNICLAIAEGVGKAHILRKILNNEALKMFKIDDKDQTSLNRATYDRNCTIVRNENIDIEASYDERISELGSTSFDINTRQKQGHNRSVSGGENDECYDTLKRFIEESETNLIGHSEDEEVKNPVELLNGVALCEGTDDIILTNWQIDFLHSQLLLKCRMKSGFILVTAAQATVTQRIHCPVWRHTQLLMKRSWTAKLSQLQYFAPLLNVGQAPAPTSPSTQPPTSQPSNQIPIIKTTNEDENVDDENINCDISSINEPTTSAESNEMDERVSETERSSKKTSSNVNFYWLSRNLIEQKHMGTTTEKSNKISDLLASGEAVGGIVYDVNNPQSVNTNFQLQRMASRCSCQLFFCYFSDIIDTEEMEQNDVIIKPMKPSHQSSNKADGWKGHKQDDVDTFTLKHNILEVSTNPEQYQMCLDIVNHLILFVDPKKNESERFRRNLSLELAKKSKQEVRETIETKQNELRDVISVFRLLERKAYFLRKGKHPKASETDEIVTPEVAFDNEQFERSLEVYKAQQNSLIDELATMISCLKEKEVEDQIEVRLKQLKSAPDDEDESTIARKFEVFFENCIWRQTESDGQISIAETQIRNFLYTRTARIDYSGDHLLEIGVVKMLNLIPNSKYKEALTRLHDPHVVPTSSTTNNVKTPSIRVICREAPPVGGVYTNDHFEVNVAPMQVQITYRFFEKMMNYFFPGKNIDYEDGKNLDDHDSIDEQQLSHQPQTSQQQQPETPQNLSFARKVTNSLSSFRRKGELIIRPDRFSKGQQRQDESDKLKERSEKNKFVYIIIPAVPFIVSYKGTKEKSILDVEHFCLYFPICEYHNKDWTWLELALAIKQRCKRMLLQQVTQRLLRIHPRQGPLLTPEPLDDEAKRRMLLGSNVTTPISKEKK